MRIDRIEAYVTDLPERLVRQVASGKQDTGEPSGLIGKPVLVKLFADGVVGYGQIRPISPGHFMPDSVGSVLAAIRDYYGPYLLGKSIFQIEQTLHDWDNLLPGNMNARAVLDVAMHDAMGKALGAPLHDLLGGQSTGGNFPLEWSVSMADVRADMVEEAVRAVRDFNIEHLCLKAGSPLGWAHDVDNFAAVRSAVGNHIDMGVDANTAWSVNETIRAVTAMRDYGISYVEQPVERNDIDGLARVRSAIQGVAVMADESLMTVYDAYRIAKAGAADALCLKLYKHGGIATARKIMNVGEAASMRVSVGGLAVQSQLEAAAGAHLLAAQPSNRILGGAEFVFGFGGLVLPDPISPEPAFDVHDGWASCPVGDGLGVIVDEDALNHHALHREVLTL